MSATVRMIEHDIKYEKDDKSKNWYCANRVWYDRYKERVIQAVGWESRDRNPDLHTSDAYDIVYRHLYDLLPPCRNCNCM